MSAIEIVLSGHPVIPRYLDLGKAPDGVDLSDVTYKVYAANGLDVIYLHPRGYTFEFREDIDSSLSDSADSIYLTGDFADYSMELVTIDGVDWLELTRGSGKTSETVRIEQSSGAYLVLADGMISVADIVAASDITLDPTVTSGTLEIVGEVRMVSADGVAQTFAGSSTDVPVVLGGSSEVDAVYISVGATVDATALSLGQDIIYLPGNWGDYQKEISGSTIIFSRTLKNAIGADRVEQITVSAGLGSHNDLLVCGDGAIESYAAKTSLSSSLTVDTDGLEEDWDTSQTSPTMPWSEGTLLLSLASDSGSSDSDGFSQDGTVQISGLSGNLRWQYSLDDGESWITVADSSKSSFVLPGQSEGDEGIVYEAGSILVREISANGVVGPISRNDAAFTIDTIIEATDLNVSDGDSIFYVLVLSGVGQAGTAVTISWDDGRSSTSAMIDANGQLQVPILFLSTGPKTLSFSATDIAGNTTNWEMDVTVSSVTGALEGLTLVSDTGSSATDGITSNGLMEVSGIWPDMSWEYSLDGGVSWQAGSGNSFVLPGQDSGEEGITYAAGDIQARLLNRFGVAGEIISYAGTVTVDGIVGDPVLDIADGDTVWDVGVFTGTGTAGAKITISGDDFSNSGTVGSNGKFSIDMAFPETGATNLTISQTDLAGNVV